MTTPPFVEFFLLNVNKTAELYTESVYCSFRIVKSLANIMPADH